MSASGPDPAERRPGEPLLVLLTEPERLSALHSYQILDTPPDETFDRVCGLAARVCETPMASVSFVDADRVWVKGAQGFDFPESPRVPGLSASAILATSPYIVRDTTADPRSVEHPFVRGRPGVRFYAGVPVVNSDGFRLGTVEVMDTRPRDLSELQLATLVDLAAIVTADLERRLAAIGLVAIERAGNHRREAERKRVGQVAETLQRSLMPARLPPVPGLDVATLYLPLSSHDVGGDFYDVFPLDGEGWWGLFLGDVCGKGLRAASLTSLARYTLRAAAVIEPDPAKIIADLNRAILLDPDSDEFSYCTVVYAGLRRSGDGWRLSTAGGGHPQPFVIRADGRVEQVQTDGPIVGCFDDAEFVDVHTDLHAGDSLLLYSDGLTDARVRGDWLGEKGLVSHLTTPGQPAADLIAEIERLIARADRPLRDDIAVLAATVPVLQPVVETLPVPAEVAQA